MASSFDKLKELNLSRDEVERIGEALKKPEFRKLLSEYVEELQDPANKKIYEEEVIQLEKERGIDVTFIHPKPGYVIKTSVNGNQKGFINICANEHVNKPSSSPAVKEGAKGLSWSLPHTLSPPREDIDNRGARCQVFDIVFHPDALHLSEKNKAFRTMVNNTALDAVESNFDVKLDKKNLKFPKLSYKGLPHSSVIKKPLETKPEHTSEEKEFYDKIFSHFPSNVPQSPSRKDKMQPRKNICDDNSNYTTPIYVIKHRSHVDLQEFTEHKEAKINAATPKELVIEINLPLLKSSSDITLDVSEKTVQLVSEIPAKYKLNLTLPYQVIESSGNAKFNKDSKTLIITLPVQRIISCGDYSDSGVESDHGSPYTPESEEELCEKHLISDLEPSEKCVEKSSVFRTSFLEENLHYNIPEFTCYVFENTIAFTLNVKNVDEKSVSKIFYTGNSVHVKFTSIGSSFYPSHYAFCVRLPMHSIDEENTTVEVWDNNVVLQVPVHCDNLKDICLRSYFYGSHSEDLSEKYVEEPEVINQILNERRDEEDVQKEPKEVSEHRDTNYDNQVSADSKKDCNTYSDFDKPSVTVPESNQQTKAIDIAGTSYESSGDELSCSSYSPRKCKGILKRLSSKQYGVGRSISESSLDDFMCSSSFENCLLSLDPEIPEDGEISTSLKKTVRFSDVIKRQMFRSNSSILGQKKKNQRKARNKKRALERRHSESEASEIEEKKEGESKDCEKQAKVGKKEENYIFDLDIDN